MMHPNAVPDPASNPGNPYRVVEARVTANEVYALDYKVNELEGDVGSLRRKLFGWIAACVVIFLATVPYLVWEKLHAVPECVNSVTMIAPSDRAICTHDTTMTLGSGINGDKYFTTVTCKCAK